MFMKKHCLFSCLCLVWMGAEISQAQNPVITSFGRNGVLTCSNLVAGSAAAVEWAPTVGGPWNSDWSALMEIAVPSNHAISVSVPMFYRVHALTNGTFTADGMGLVPAGSFIIGDTLDGDLPDAQPTNVFVSDFYIDTNLVSGSLWSSVMTYAGSHGFTFAASGGSGEGYAKATNHPMSQCMWSDTLLWCNARSLQAGLTPVYYADAGLTEVYTNGLTQTNGFYPKWTAKGYRLPTEAEFEKAARGALEQHRFPNGNLISWAYANYYGNLLTWSVGAAPNSYFSYGLSPPGENPTYSTNTSAPYTSPVGSFPPNGYGLYDMTGNDYEWCWDWYAGPPYPVGSAYLGGSDPRGPATGAYRVSRGTSWNFDAAYARCAHRTFGTQNQVYGQQGIRCVRVP
jgi:sulfatase modifying factor 1